MNAEVFISYASEDRLRILNLVERLRRAGVSVWIDQMGIEGATMWSQEIVEAIDGCKVLILAISQRSTESENVVKELALASERRKKILPVCLDSSGIPKSMEYQLAGIQRVEYVEGEEEQGLLAMIRSLGKLGVTVSDEASEEAAKAPGFVSHGPSHYTASGAKQTGAPWVKIGIAVVGVGVLAVGMFLLGGSNQAPPSEKPLLGQAETNVVEGTKPLAKPVTLDTNRVVVLPFKTIDTSGETADLGYGLVSTLTSKLQPLQNLTVIAKESARQYEDSKLPPKEIGQALGAGTIVTGEIQTSGNKVQVNVQLIDANTEDLGWGSTFTKSKEEFLDLQNEIATKLASELKGELEAGEAQQLAQKATDNPEAHSEYQKGRREWNKRSKEGFAKAINHFKRAIELDPDFANPFAGLADTYGLLSSYNLEPALEVMPKAKLNAEKAIELNPNLAEAFASLAWYQFIFEFDRKGAEENFDKAIKLNPNYATAYHWFGLMMNTSLELDRSTVLLKKALELEPTSLIIPSNLAQAYRLAGQFELAMETCEIAFETNPNFPPAVHYYTMCHDDYQDSIKRLKGAIQAYPSIPMSRRALFRAFMSNGEVDLAKDQLIYSLDHFHDKMTLGFAEMYAGLGRYDEAFRWLKKGVESRESSATFVLVAFHFPDDFKEDSRFVELMKSMNNPLYVDK
ncbi:MAG: TIR domain-containing protein [Verrucomicrobiota bacterium]|nr:TIR domain-containing protein [Verrucomicrobiota bacterium]